MQVTVPPRILWREPAGGFIDNKVGRAIFLELFGMFVLPELEGVGLRMAIGGHKRWRLNLSLHWGSLPRS